MPALGSYPNFQRRAESLTLGNWAKGLWRLSRHLGLPRPPTWEGYGSLQGRPKRAGIWL